MDFFYIYLVICIICGYIGGKVAESKNRPAYHGFFLGMIFGLLGILICYTLPQLPKKE